MNKKILFSVTSIILPLLLLAVTNVRSQYSWRTVHAQRDDSTKNYSMLLLSCQGTHCTAVAAVERTEGHSYVFLRSDDAGGTWKEQLKIRDGGNPYAGYIFAWALQQIDSANVVMVGDSGRILRTFDGGNNWVSQQTPAPFTYGSLRGVDFHDSLNGVIALPDRSMWTSDGGTHWTLGPITGLITSSCWCYGPGNFAVIRNRDARVFRTRDSWHRIDSSLAVLDTAIHLPDFRWCSWGTGDTLIAYGYDARDHALIARTSDGGDSWRKSALEYPDPVISMTPVIDDTVFAGSGDFSRNVIFYSFDDGQTWKHDSVMVESQGVSFGFDAVSGVCRPQPGVVLAIAQALPGNVAPSIIMRGTLQKADVGIHPIFVESFASPNPAHQSITIDFSALRGPALVHDILGREVMQFAPESGPLTLDLSRIASGIYEVSRGVEHARFVKQ